jgi:hypothetical protein
MSLTLSLIELRRTTEVLFKHLQDSGHETVELNEDYYWIISEKERYNPYHEPKNLMLGQLYDNWQNLQDLTAGRLLPIPAHFERLSSILTYLGDSLDRPTRPIEGQGRDED